MQVYDFLSSNCAILAYLQVCWGLLSWCFPYGFHSSTLLAMCLSVSLARVESNPKPFVISPTLLVAAQLVYRAPHKDRQKRSTVGTFVPFRAWSEKI